VRFLIGYYDHFVLKQTYIFQFSKMSPLMGSKCFSLLVTRLKPFSMAMPAISMSVLPMVIPRCLKS